MHARGLSLVDLLIGLAIGMIATVVILNMMVMFDTRRRSAAGNAEADIHAAFASAALARELRVAGNGLGPSSALGCVTHRAASGTPTASFPLVPVMITQGSQGLPDTFTMLAAGEQVLPAARLIAPYAVGAAVMTLDSTLGIAEGTQLLLHTAGQSECALVGVASVSMGAYTVQPVVASGLLSGVQFPTDSAVQNLGRLRYRRFSVDAQQRLQQESLDAATGAWVTSTRADSVVNLQLQYGFDTRTGVQTAPFVTLWTDDVIDADADGQTGDADDWQRLLAVRFALVVRSAQRREEACDAPTPTWLAGDARGVLVATDISLAHLSQWRCWRYRVLQSEVPLRNQLWHDR